MWLQRKVNRGACLCLKLSILGFCWFYFFVWFGWFFSPELGAWLAEYFCGGQEPRERVRVSLEKKLAQCL